MVVFPLSPLQATPPSPHTAARSVKAPLAPPEIVHRVSARADTLHGITIAYTPCERTVDSFPRQSLVSQRHREWGIYRLLWAIAQPFSLGLLSFLCIPPESPAAAPRRGLVTRALGKRYGKKASAGVSLPRGEVGGAASGRTPGEARAMPKPLISPGGQCGAWLKLVLARGSFAQPACLPACLWACADSEQGR